MKPESCDHAPYPPPGWIASAARAIKMTSTPSHGLNRTHNANARDRARGDRDDDGARATRRAMDARENARGRGKRARGFGWDRRARSGARDAGEEGRGGSGSRRARSYLQTRAEAREPGRARDARGMMARDDGEERWRGRRTRERWARRATRRREAGRLTTRGFSKRAGDEGENDARGARDAGGSGDARRRHWTARTAEEEG